MWAKGLASVGVRREIGDGLVGVEVDGRLVTMWRSEVREYLDEQFWSVLDLWWRWKVLGGFPFTGGWAEQPAHLMEAIELAEAAHRSVEHGGSR